MSLFNNRIARAKLLGTMSFADVGAHIGSKAESVYDASASASLLGNESHRLDANAVATATQTHSNIKTALADLIGNESYARQENMIENAARTAMLYADPANLNNAIKGIASLGNESFSSVSGLTQSRDYAVALAMVDASARDASAINQIFPIVDLNAEYVTATLSLPRYEMVGNEYHVGHGADLTDWGRIHLVSAARKSGLLKGNQNKMYPAVVSGENDGLIIPTAKVAHGDIKSTGGTSFKTGKISNAASMNLMTLCRAPGMPSSDSANYNDRIDAGGRIEKVFVNLADDVVEAVSVRHLSESIFGRGQQTSSRSTVNAALRSFVFRKDLTNATNAKLIAVRDAGATEMEIKLELNMTLDLHSGALTQTYSVALIGLYADANGTVNIIDDAGFDVSKAALAVEFLGSELDTRWSSRSLRLDGMRVDTRTIDKTYPMTAQRVITSDREIDTANVDDVLSAMNMARGLSREDDGFSYLLEEIKRMNTLYGTAGTTKLDPENTQYAGAYYLTQAWVKDAGEIELKNLVKLENSSDTQADIGAAIVALLAEELTTAVGVSGLEDVVKVYAPGAEITPVIAGPANILRYIMKTGDDRTFGSKGTIITAKPEFAQTNLDSFDDTLVMIPQVTGGKGDASKAFSFGFTLECPPLVYDVPSERDGQTIRALKMTPFYEFVINMPVAYKVKITGITTYLESLKITPVS